jgi:hypothetical protein
MTVASFSVTDSLGGMYDIRGLGITFSARRSSSTSLSISRR